MNTSLFFTTTIVLLMIVGTDIFLRFKYSEDKAKDFEKTAVVAVVISIFLLSQSLGQLSYMFTFAIALMWIFRETINNLGSSILIYLYPPFELNDVLTINGREGLVYRGVGLLRTKFIKATGEEVHIPNRILFNDTIDIA